MTERLFTRTDLAILGKSVRLRPGSPFSHSQWTVGVAEWLGTVSAKQLMPV